MSAHPAWEALEVVWTVGMPTSTATPSLPATEGNPCQTAPEEAGPSKLESFYLNSGFGYHISSLVMKAQELAISHEVLQKKLWHMAAAQWINQKQQRHALEQRICLRLGPQQQVAYVDCASYHDVEASAGDCIMQHWWTLVSPSPTCGRVLCIRVCHDYLRRGAIQLVVRQVLNALEFLTSS